MTERNIMHLGTFDFFGFFTFTRRTALGSCRTCS